MIIAGTGHRPSRLGGYDDQARYHRLLLRAAEVVVLGRDTDTTAAHRARDRWMVDNRDVLLALWDGEERGGTWYTVRYVWSKGRPIVHLWASWVKYRWGRVVG